MSHRWEICGRNEPDNRPVGDNAPFWDGVEPVGDDVQLLTYRCLDCQAMRMTVVKTGVIVAASETGECND